MGSAGIGFVRCFAEALGCRARFRSCKWLPWSRFFAYAAIAIDGYLTLDSIYSTLVLAALLGIAASGQTLYLFYDRRCRYLGAVVHRSWRDLDH